MPPNGIFSSASPPTQKSTASRPVVVTPFAPLAHAPVLLRKSNRSDGAPAPPNTSSEAAARLSSSVTALGDRGVRAIGGDEVDQRFRVLDMLHEIGPADVGLELAVAGHVVEFAPRRVQRRNAGVAAARDVDGRKIERQAEQVVAHRFGHELVDLVADLARHAAHDGAGRFFRRRAARRERERIEEGRDQADLAALEIRDRDGRSSRSASNGRSDRPCARTPRRSPD